MEFTDFEDMLSFEECSLSNITPNTYETKTFDELCDEVLILSDGCNKEVEIEGGMKNNKQNVSRQFNIPVYKKTNDVFSNNTQGSQSSLAHSNLVSHPELKAENLRLSPSSDGKLKYDFNTSLSTDKHKKCLLTVHKKDNINYKQSTINNDDQYAHYGEECRLMSKNLKASVLCMSSYRQQTFVVKEVTENNNIPLFVSSHTENIPVKQDKEIINSDVMNREDKSSLSLAERRALRKIVGASTSEDMKKPNLKSEDCMINRSLNPPRKVSSLTNKSLKTISILSKGLNQRICQNSGTSEKYLPSSQIKEKCIKVNIPDEKCSYSEKCLSSEEKSEVSDTYLNKMQLRFISQSKNRSFKNSLAKETLIEADYTTKCEKDSSSFNDHSATLQKSQSNCATRISDMKEKTKNSNVTTSKVIELNKNCILNFNGTKIVSKLNGDEELLNSFPKNLTNFTSRKFISSALDVKNYVEGIQETKDENMRNDKTNKTGCIKNVTNEKAKLHSNLPESTLASRTSIDDESVITPIKLNKFKGMRGIERKCNSGKVQLAQRSETIKETDNLLLSCEIKENTKFSGNEIERTVKEGNKQSEERVHDTTVQIISSHGPKNISTNMLTNSKNTNTRNEQGSTKLVSEQEEIKFVNIAASTKKENELVRNNRDINVDVIEEHKALNDSDQKDKKSERNSQQYKKDDFTLKHEPTATSDVEKPHMSRHHLKIISSKEIYIHSDSLDSKTELSVYKHLRSKSNLTNSASSNSRGKVTDSILENRSNGSNNTIGVVTPATSVFRGSLEKSKPILSRTRMQNTDNGLKNSSLNLETEKNCKSCHTLDTNLQPIQSEKCGEKCGKICDKNVSFPTILNTISLTDDKVVTTDGFTNAQDKEQIEFPSCDNINGDSSVRKQEVEDTNYFPAMFINNMAASFDSGISNVNNPIDRKIAVSSRRRGAARLLPFVKTTRTVIWGVGRFPIEGKIDTLPLTRFRTQMEAISLPIRETFVKISKDLTSEDSEIDVINTNDEIIASSQQDSLAITGDKHEHELLDNRSVVPLQNDTLTPQDLDVKTCPSLKMCFKNENGTRKRAAEFHEDPSIPSTKKQKVEIDELNTSVPSRENALQNSKDYLKFKNIRSSMTLLQDSVSTPMKNIIDYNEQSHKKTISQPPQGNDSPGLTVSNKPNQENLKNKIEELESISETSSNLFVDKTINTKVFASEKSNSSSPLSSKTKIPRYKRKSVTDEFLKPLHCPNKSGTLESAKTNESQPASAEVSKKSKSESIVSPVRLVKRSPAKPIQRNHKIELETNNSLTFQQRTAEAQIRSKNDKISINSSSAMCMRSEKEISSGLQSSLVEGLSKVSNVSSSGGVRLSVIQRSSHRLNHHRRTTVPVAIPIPLPIPMPNPDLIPVPSPSTSTRFLRRRVLRPSLPVAPTSIT